MVPRWFCLIALCLIVVAWPLPAGAAPLGTAITYQGQLKQSGVPYGGLADLRLTLYDAVSGGAVIAGPVTLTNVSVVNGLFTVQVDFGAPVPGATTFGSDARWVLIEVRSPAGSGSYTALTPRQAVTAVPNAIFASKPWVTSGLNLSYTAGKVGIGTASPTSALDIEGSQDALRITGFQPLLTLRDSNSSNARNVFQSVAGGLNLFTESYLAGANPSAFLRFDNSGRLGIGTATTPNAKLYVEHTTGGANNQNAIYGVTDGANGNGVYGQNTNPLGRGVGGQALGASGIGGIFEGGNVGVFAVQTLTTGIRYGIIASTSSPAGYAVSALGNFAASGTKSFRIDHPDDPANRYLLHYSAESPDVINFYSGNVTLDKAGEAVVELPPYFAKINRDPRYTLTAIGAPMPMLHVAGEIAVDALAAGAKAEPAQAAAVCTFRIAGGVAGAKVSWRVDAVRNDRWMRHAGSPVEAQKQGIEKGLYQHPELYGQPQEMSMHHRPEAKVDAAPANQP